MDRHGASRASTFRFTRIGPDARARQLDRASLARIAERMTGQFPGTQDSHIPAGYTYFGQFVAHDVSFDLSTGGLGTRMTPERLVQGRSPALDLDSLYGDGPGDPASRRFYQGRRGPLLRTGHTRAAGGVAQLEGHDLPRERRTAVIPDPRNDDNLAVAQIHAAFIRLHNRVVEQERVGFRAARELVTLHFQWLVWHDYLPRICDRAVLDDVRSHGRRLFDVGADPHTPPKMPLEFSAAAFRLGHSMVRGVYPWNIHLEDPILRLDDLFRFAGRGGDLGGNPVLPSTHVADFRRLFDPRDAGAPPGPANVIRALRIDVAVTPPLSGLRPGMLGSPDPPADALERNLAFRNLMRARRVGLATGQDMVAPARATQLTAAQLAGTDRLGDALGARGLQDTPLWVYILREAELHGGRLTGVGARIVAETFDRAIEGSRISLFRDTPGWQPTLGADRRPYSMAHVLLYTAGDDPAQLSPAG